MDSATAVLQQVSQLNAGSELAKLILFMYEKLLNGASLKQLRKAADDLTAQSLQNVRGRQ